MSIKRASYGSCRRRGRQCAREEEELPKRRLGGCGGPQHVRLVHATDATRDSDSDSASRDTPSPVLPSPVAVLHTLFLPSYGWVHPTEVGTAYYKSCPS